MAALATPMKCSRCSDAAIIRLHYCDRQLCAKHFILMFDKRLRSTVREFSMVEKGDRIAIALSGGKDSTVLLRCMHELSKDLPTELVAITIDEGIAGYRADTLQAAKKEAKRLKVEHRVVSFKKELGKSLDSIIKTQDPEPGTRTLPCSWCGVFRRGLLNSAAREAGADKLALGHNLDDMAQTVLMNVLRNEPSRTGRLLDAAKGAKGGSFVRRIRPLMRTPEKEVAIYAMARGMEIPRKECPYARTAFRQLVRAQLNETEELHPGTKFKVLSSVLAVPQQDAGRAGVRCVSCGTAGNSRTCKFCELSGKIKSR